MQKKSFKFKNIESNLVKLLSLLINNQNIKRYVTYLDDTPLDVSKPDVTDKLTETGNIILTLFDQTILTEPKVRIFFNPFTGKFDSQPLSDITFLMDIIIPTQYWKLNGLEQLRAFRIADEFAQMVDGQNVAGIGEVSITNFKSYKVNDAYSGLTLFINVNSSSLKGLR